MFGLIKKIFIGLLISTTNASNHTKCLLLSNQKCKTQLTPINLHPNEYSQEFHYYPFTVKLDRCIGSCNTLNDLSNKVCVPNKTEDLNLSVFSTITGINDVPLIICSQENAKNKGNRKHKLSSHSASNLKSKKPCGQSSIKAFLDKSLPEGKGKLNIDTSESGAVVRSVSSSSVLSPNYFFLQKNLEMLKNLILI